MARYQIPPDPRKGDSETDHAYRVGAGETRSSPPWLWIGLGAVVTVLAIAVAILWARLLLDIPAEEVEPTPTVILRTAVPTSPPPTVTAAGGAPVESTLEGESPEGPSPTEEPTVVPPGSVGIGMSVRVVDTGVGLNLRAEPLVADDNILALVPDGTVLEVVGGPEVADDFTWWQLRMSDGTEGWGVDQFLQVP
jgi:hypothetical protein